MSTAVWVGMIALMGVDAQTGVFMLLYLDLAYEAALSAGALAQLGRFAAGDPGGCGKANSSEIHDGHDDDNRAVADFVVDSARGGPDETNRRTDGWRDGVVVSHGIADISGALCDVEAAHGRNVG